MREPKTQTEAHTARQGAHVPRPPAAPIKGLAAGGRGACAQRTPAASFGGVSVTPPQ